MTKNRKFGWIPDKVDSRDILYSTAYKAPREYPDVISVRVSCPPVYSQGSLSSCVGNAVAAGVDFAHLIQGLGYYNPSRLFIYYNARKLEGTQDQDIGCTIRDAIKSVVQQGVCSEIDWPYIISNVNMEPTLFCYNNAMNEQVISYQRLGYIETEFERCLYEGYPFTIGARIFENFPMETSTGIIPMPEGEIIGGHAMLIVGYNKLERMFTIRNSWGENWGDGGYGYIPFDYVLNNGWSGDFWTIRTVESENSIPSISNKGCLVSILKILGNMKIK
jgi:C1A family cysteine protease